MGGAISYYSLALFVKTNDPDSTTGLSSREKYYISLSWNEIKKNPTKFGNSLFTKYFSRHPHYLNYFPFKNTSVDKLVDNKSFQAHSMNVINAIAAVINNINNKVVLENLLLENGNSHASRSIPEKAYWDLKMVIIESVKEVLGNKHTNDISASWNKLLDAAFTIIIKGHHKDNY